MTDEQQPGTGPTGPKWYVILTYDNGKSESMTDPNGRLAVFETGEAAEQAARSTDAYKWSIERLRIGAWDSI